MLASTQAFPPDLGGTAVMLYELLRHLPDGSLVAVSGTTYNRGDSGHGLPFPDERVLVLGSRGLSARAAWRAPTAYTRLIVRRICAVARRYGVQRIYAHYPNSVFLLSGYLAAERLGLPLVVFFDQLWEETGENVALALRYEHRIVERAETRFALTDYQVDHLSAKHGVAFALMPHVIDADVDHAAYHPLPASGPRQVHFAGGIYPKMNLDSVRRMARVIDASPHDLTFELCTMSSIAQLRSDGLPTGRLRVHTAPRAELARTLANGHVMYLPQAFESSTPEMVRCNFPTKALDYMAAGRPMLVHSPPGSYLSDLTRRHGFGLVVDRPDDGALAAGLERMLTDEAANRRFVEAGFEFLRTRNPRDWSRRFYEGLVGRENLPAT